VTFRLYDWDHVDPKTGQRRPLHVDQALACIDFTQGAIGPVAPVVEQLKGHKRERLFLCEHFGVWRTVGEAPFTVGAADTPRVLVCIDGEGRLEHGGTNYGFDRGDVLLLPAVVGACSCRPLVEVSCWKFRCLRSRNYLSDSPIALIPRTPLLRSSDGLNLGIMSTIANMDGEERQKAVQAFEYLREAKVNLVERVRYGAPNADIASAIEEFEEACSGAERLVNQLIAPAKP
jgi:hypothetical protein